MAGRTRGGRQGRIPEVIWLPEALGASADKNPLATRNDVLCIQAAARHLQDFPEIGRPLPDDSQRREVFAASGAGAYARRYRLNRFGQPVLIRVWHTRAWRGD